MISDGFGDLTPGEVAERFHKWSHKVAGAYVKPSDSRYEDLAQEAMIQIWRVVEKKGSGVSATYLAQAGKYRMQAILSGKQEFGGDPTPGPRYRPSETRVDWQGLAADGAEDSLGSLLEAADLVEAIEWAYHHGEIAEAINSLPSEHREYVVKRFWQGMTDTEIAAAWGMNQKAVSLRWNRRIKPALTEALAHLVSL